jgi:outer membrane lipoprotein-sorting protein
MKNSLASRPEAGSLSPNPQFPGKPMKKFFYLLFVPALLAASMVNLAAASAEDLIQAHLKAIGGVEAHKKHTSRVMKGTLQIPEQGISAEITIHAKAPNLLRTELEIPGVGKMVEGFDGKAAWSDNPFTGAAVKPADQQAQARRQAQFYRDVELLTRFDNWTLKGKESVGGKPAHVIEGKANDGAIETLYLDAATHMLIQAKTRDDGVNATVRFADHRDVDGIKIPFTIEVDAGPAGTFSMRVTEVKHGVELDEKLFRMAGQ